MYWQFLSLKLIPSKKKKMENDVQTILRQTSPAVYSRGSNSSSGQFVLIYRHYQVGQRRVHFLTYMLSIICVQVVQWIFNLLGQLAQKPSRTDDQAMEEEEEEGKCLSFGSPYMIKNSMLNGIRIFWLWHTMTPICWARWHELQLLNPEPPKGRPWISDVSPLTGISGLPASFHFSISPLLFSLVLSLFLSYLFLHLAHSPDFFFCRPPFPKGIIIYGL